MKKPKKRKTYEKPSIEFQASQIDRYKDLPDEDKHYIAGAITTLLYKAGSAPEIEKPKEGTV